MEFEGDLGKMIGSKGEGVKKIMDMVKLKRIDWEVDYEGIMR